MFSFNLCPVIRRPTRNTSTSNTLIDHIWTNDSTFKCSGIIPNYVTDHFSVFVTCETPVPSYFNGEEIVSKRIFSSDNKQKFTERLNSIDWTNFFYIDCINDLYKKFNETLTEIFEECFPLCYSRKKTIDINKPYINRHIKQLIVEKKKLLKLYNRYPLTYCSAYKACRNKVNIEVRKAKRAYFKDNLKKMNKTQEKRRDI